MDMQEQAMQGVVAQTIPEMVIEADEYQVKRARGWVEQALARHLGEGNWELGNIKTMIMENPVPGISSVQFWFVMLIDKVQSRVVGDIFYETRDE